jgi:glycosyltransferase involved in cell wall biosynthesis
MVVYAYYPLGETRVQREAEALIADGYEVDVVCTRLPNEAATEICSGVHVYRMPMERSLFAGILPAHRLWEYLLFWLMAMVTLVFLYGKRRYTTIQVHNLPDFLVFVAWLPKVLGTPVLLDLHDLMPEFYVSRYGKSPDSLIVKLVRVQESLSCRFADHVITVSEHWREWLIQRGVPAEKCSVVMNLADPRIFHLPESVPHKPATDGEFRLFYHGTVKKQYGLDLVVRAVDRLRGDIPGIRCTIVGHGDVHYMARLRELIAELELQDLVDFESTTRPVEEIPGLIMASDLGVVAYRSDPFTDGLLPTKLMEYAAMGLPSVAARTPAIKRYFEGTAVELFAPGDIDDLTHHILMLYRNRPRLKELAQKAEIFNQRHNWPTEAESYVKLVNQLAGQ